MKPWDKLIEMWVDKMGHYGLTLQFLSAASKTDPEEIIAEMVASEDRAYTWWYCTTVKNPVVCFRHTDPDHNTPKGCRWIGSILLQLVRLHDFCWTQDPKEMLEVLVKNAQARVAESKPSRTYITTKLDKPYVQPYIGANGEIQNRAVTTKTVMGDAPFTANERMMIQGVLGEKAI